MDSIGLPSLPRRRYLFSRTFFEFSESTTDVIPPGKGGVLLSPDFRLRVVVSDIMIPFPLQR